ncbi:hypothetical protein TNCV_3978021 [Trichonephila clavipes]|nr:hypothetical protein TNCV_3978021 [Trichonephila clavipes]
MNQPHCEQKWKLRRNEERHFVCYRLQKPRRKAVVEFRLIIGHDCLLKHLHRIDVAQSPFCTLYDFLEDMDADDIHLGQPLLAS